MITIIRKVLRMRKTEQRSTILNNLKSRSDHPSADDVYFDVRQSIPRISLGTVYRNLDKLAQQGLIQKLEYPGAQKRFDGNPAPHTHFLCINCGKINDIPEDAVSVEVNNSHSWTRDREFQAISLTIQGLCKACKAESEED